MRSRNNTRFVTLFVALVAAWASQASAIMLEYGLERLVRDSQSAVIGKVVAKESMWSDEQRRRIHTLVTIDVAQNVFGKATARVVVRIAGGTAALDDGTSISMGQSDTPKFDLGEEVLLFLKPAKAGATERKITGAFQGKFRITTDRESGKKTVRSKAKKLVHPTTMKPRRVAAYSVALDTFVARVRAIDKRLGKR